MENRAARRNARRPGLLLALLPLAACAAGSFVTPVGPGTYFVTALRAPAVGGGPEAYRVVTAEAEAFCRQQGRHALTIDMRPDGDPFTPFYPVAFDDTFRCSATPQAGRPD